MTTRVRATGRPSPLRIRRLLRGLRLVDVEHATGLPALLVSQLERGEGPPSAAALAELARFYATDAAQLRAEMDRWAVGEARRVLLGGQSR
jgi:transcriptional regulator with XRE-family HTH domain